VGLLNHLRYNIHNRVEHLYMSTNFRALPSVHKILSDHRIEELVNKYSHRSILNLVRSELDKARNSITNGQKSPEIDQVIVAVEKNAEAGLDRKPISVINATGVVLHTNLGRAPLSDESIYSVEQAAKNYSDLEYDLDHGSRGSRQKNMEYLLRQITGAEASVVFNNNAAAIFLALAAITHNKEVIVSRGEAVEIGGGFRIPDILNQSGASLIDVGTTNRTYLSDYEAAISNNTGAILSIHSSNFQVTGFTHSPDIDELVELGKRKNIPVLHDMGSGCLIDTKPLGIVHEPMPQESIKSGVSLVFFSGDKLLGGPQSGIIVGNRQLIDLISQHPIARACRIDKLNMAALTTTLLHYVKEEATQKIPIWKMITQPIDEIQKRVTYWKDSLGSQCSIINGVSTIGGGSAPGETIPTFLLRIDCRALDMDAITISDNLRYGNSPIVSRIENEYVLLDPRTVLLEQDEKLLKTTQSVIAKRI